MNDVVATVLLPTTGDRGPLLPYSVKSIQDQTIKNIEIFIVGDGVNEDTRSVIHQLKKEDDRISFFDFPKHVRRGEENRHKILQGAKGRIICYLCDRDLMLPYHIEIMNDLLADGINFASTIHMYVSPIDKLWFDSQIRYYGYSRSAENRSKSKIATITLSNVGHTLEFYNQLPYGWRTTPKNQFTDVYMWKQFMNHKSCNAFSSHKATTLFFKRQNYPGWPVSKRLPEIRRWSKKLETLNDFADLETQALIGLLERKSILKRDLQGKEALLDNNLILVKGKNPLQYLGSIKKKLLKFRKLF